MKDLLKQWMNALQAVQDWVSFNPSMPIPSELSERTNSTQIAYFSELDRVESRRT